MKREDAMRSLILAGTMLLAACAAGPQNQRAVLYVSMTGIQEVPGPGDPDGNGTVEIRVDPVVIMLAEHEGRVLLGRQPHYPERRYSALAGFVEPGESIEEAVARELMEEAGVAVGDVRYVASQPWPFPGSLMIACLARAESDALRLDRNELEDAFWASREEVAAALAGDPAAPFLAPPPFAIANTLLARWSAGG